MAETAGERAEESVAIGTGDRHDAQTRIGRKRGRKGYAQRNGAGGSRHRADSLPAGGIFLLGFNRVEPRTRVRSDKSEGTAVFNNFKLDRCAERLVRPGGGDHAEGALLPAARDAHGINAFVGCTPG